MAIIGSAEVEVRADVRKLGKDITDSFNDLSKTADDIADKMGKSIGDSLKKNLDGLTIKVNIDDSILDDIIEIEEQINRISNQTVKIDLDDSAMDKVNTYHGKTLRYDVDLDTTYLDAQLAKIADQKIDLKVDNKSAKAIRDSVEKTVSGMPATSRTVPVEMDIDSRSMNFLNEKMKKAMEGAQRVAKKHAEPIDLELNTDKLMEHLEMLKDYETEDIAQGITIEQSDLEEINSAIESLRQYNQANAIELEAELHMAKVMAQLAYLTRKQYVEIAPKINAKAMAIAQGTLAGFSGFNIMKDHTKDFIQSLTELDKQLPQTALLLTALSAAVPVAGWGAGTLTMLIGDVAALSGLLVPGSAALAAYAGGMFFLNNAFSKTNKEKFIPEITAQLSQLSETVAGDFWSVAKPSYNDFAFKTLPALYGATKGVNTGMAELASGFWDSIGVVLETGRGMRNLEQIADNVQEGMKGLTGAFEPAMQALLTFVRVGSSYLPGLGEHIADLAEQFDSWMQTMDETGALNDWADAGINALKELGVIVYSTVGIIYSLYRAADRVGFPGLTELAAGLDSLNKKLQENKAQDTLVALGLVVNEAFGKMAASLAWVGPLISDNITGILELIVTMGDIASEVLGGIGDAVTNTGLVDSFFGLFESMKTAVELFRPAFESIGTIMAVTFDFLGSALENITPILTQFFENLENDAVLVKPALMGMLDIFGEWGPRVMEVVGQVTNGIAEWFGNLDPIIALAGIALVGLGPIIATVVGAFFGFIGAISSAVGSIAALWGAITTLGLTAGPVGTFFTWLGTVILNVGSKFTGFASTVTGAFSGLAGKIGPALGSIGSAISTFFSNLGGRISGLMAPMTNSVGGAFAALRQSIGLMFQGLIIEVTAFFGPMGTAVQGAFATLRQNVGLILQGLVTEIKTLLGPSLTGAISNTFSRIGGLFSGVVQWVGRLVPGLGSLGGGFGTLAAKVATSIPGIGFIVSAFITAITVSSELRQAIGGFLVNAFMTLAAFVQPLIGPLMSLVGVILDISTQIGVVLAPAFASIFNVLNSLFPIVQLVARVLGVVLGGAITMVGALIKGVWAAVAPILTGAVTFVSSAFNGIAGIISGVIDVIVNLVTGDFAGAFESLKGIGTTILDMLKGMFDGVVQMLIGLFTGAVGQITEIFTGIGETILGILQGFGLGEAGTQIIQSLIDGFRNAMDKVRQWLQDLTQKIIEWKGPPSTDATLLNDAGASIIQSLIDGFISVVQNVFSFLQNLTAQIVNVVMGVINGVVAVFQTGWNILVTIVQTVWNAIITVITTILQVLVAGIQVYINLIVTVFQTGWTILTTVVQTVWNMIVTIITTVFQVIVAGIQVYINLVVTIFQTGWSVLTTVIQAVWLGIQTVIQGAWTIIQTIITTALTAVVTVFSTIWNSVVNIVMTVWMAIQTSISTAINAVRVIITTVLTGIMTVISTVWNTVKTVTQTVWNGIKALIGLGLAAIKALISGNFAAFRSIISSIWNTIKSITTSVWNAIRSGISSVVNSIRSVITTVFNAIRNVIRSVMNGIKSVITSIWNGIRSTITSVVNGVRSVVTSTFNAIRSVISSVMNAARSIISSVWSSIRSTVSSAVNGVRSAVSSGFNALRGIVSSAWNAVVTTVRSAANRMLGIVRGIPGQIKGALGNLGSLLTGAGRSIIQGLINGVTGMIGSLKSKFSDITNMIPDWKGPPDTDAKLLTNAGELIMEGLISGLESKYGAVKNSLQGFTGELSQTVGTQIGADVGLTTSVRNTALSDAERRLAYRSNNDSMVQSNGGSGEVHLHFHNTLVNEEEIIMVVNREFGRR